MRGQYIGELIKESFYIYVFKLFSNAKKGSAAVNRTIVFLYYEFGRMIVEE